MIERAAPLRALMISLAYTVLFLKFDLKCSMSNLVFTVIEQGYFSFGTTLSLVKPACCYTNQEVRLEEARLID
jgi:hypothetical protein